jgi:DUF4097 and DUF4098 domain-containing protein YvlB
MLRPAVLAALVSLSAVPFLQAFQPPAQSGAGPETESGSVSAEGVRRLKVSSVGSVTANGSDGARIEYRLIRRSRGSGENQARPHPSPAVRVNRSGGTLTLSVEMPGDAGFPPRLELIVPKRLLETQIDTVSGSLQLYGLGGHTAAETGGGPVRIGRIHGSLSVRTGGGPIEADSVQLGLRCLTAGGDIRVRRAGGETSLETGGGEILVEEAGAALQAFTAAGNVEVLRAFSDVAARTMGGLIKVYEAAGQVNAETRGGGIQVGAARGVRCEAAAGGVRLRNVSGAVNVSTVSGPILAEIVRGLPLESSKLHAARGDITVLIPSNLSVTVQAMNELPGRYGRIVSEFPEIRSLPVIAPVRGPVMAEAALNGGGPVLRLAAVQGTIFLRRRD